MVYCYFPSHGSSGVFLQATILSVEEKKDLRLRSTHWQDVHQRATQTICLNKEKLSLCKSLF